MTTAVREAAVPTPTLRIGVSVDGTGTVAYHLFGDLDARTAERFRLETASAPREPRVIVDLTHVGFIDSAGLGALTHLVRRMLQAGRLSAIVTKSPAITRLLDDADLTMVVPVVTSSSAAFRSPPAVLPDGNGGFPSAPSGL